MRDVRRPIRLRVPRSVLALMWPAGGRPGVHRGHPRYRIVPCTMTPHAHQRWVQDIERALQKPRGYYGGKARVRLRDHLRHARRAVQ